MSDPELWSRMRTLTQARIGLGRSGNALPTFAELEFRAAHAAARDAVHAWLNIPELVKRLPEPPILVTSRASDRGLYLRRPDLGRELSAPLEVPPADVVLIVADGLSARAVDAHASALLCELIPLLPPELVRAPVVMAQQARVAIGDQIGAAFGARLSIVLIGERPGLSVDDSLGVYLTHNPRPGRTDAQRNCVSNIHPPEGLGYAAAARSVAALVRGALELGASGVALKDRTFGNVAGIVPATLPKVGE